MVVCLHCSDTLVPVTPGKRREAMMRAAIYTRIGRENGSRDADRQLAECRQWAESHGYGVASEFCDEDVSASKYTRRQRPGFDQLMKAVDDGAADAVIVADTGRLTRNTTELLGV